MAIQCELPIRKKRQHPTKVSPDNFHRPKSDFLMGQPSAKARVKETLASTSRESSEFESVGESSATDDEPDAIVESSGGDDNSTASRDASAYEHTDSEVPYQKRSLYCEKNKRLRGNWSPTSSTDTSEKCSKASKKKQKDKVRLPSEDSSQLESASGMETPLQETIDQSDWSLSEDYVLRGMKKDDNEPSWTEIAKSLNRSKKDVQSRWKMIKHQTSMLDSDTDKDSDDFDLENGGGKLQRSKSHQPKGNPKGKVKEPKEQHHNDVSKGQNKAIGVQSARRSSRSILSGEEPSSDNSSSRSSSIHELTYGNSTTALGEERARQRRYLHQNVLRDLYPPELQLQPDEYFGKRDCEILAAVDSRYKRARWLEMQANFYNVTGRMVPLGVIREKCERAEREERKTRNSWREEGGRKSVERWISAVEPGDHHDHGAFCDS